MKIHTWAWLAWLIAGLVVISSTRNPLYLILFDLILLILQMAVKPTDGFLSFTTYKFAASVLVLSTLLNTVISRFGETVLFQIPAFIPLLKGPVTLEAIVFGFTNGLVLTGMFTLFTIINRVLPVQVIVRLIPQFLQPVALVTTIALTFLPATQRQFNAIKEAQAVRGQRIQRLRDWLPLFIPLLIGGLERSMQIAEAMTARGFSPSDKVKSPAYVSILSISALVLLISGWVLQLTKTLQLAGLILMVVGIILLITLYFLRSRQIKKTRYQEERWSRSSSIILFSAFFAALAFLFLTPGKFSIIYEAYPLVVFPQIALTQVTAILIFLMPLFYIKVGENDND
jgi:energy-coupling factor transport system permease protein